ncbi:ABC transporter permease [Marinobacterium lutimaris]|uniref:Putative spermidine/putrescine transport system permease protein n=1 Tax=Marinobacterium lutimaris TaxID=568106 RepID=A0A1H6DP93_9GAMM|nr:ABC transporter permease [Marinobacterium lutimaris]SEG87021.1 putative spermidine/putrescine transport system permease protein [Marinobacterium lutimaris]
MSTLTIPSTESTTAAVDPSVKLLKREQRTMLMLLSPALAVVTLLLVVPLGWLFIQSFYSDGFTLEHYARIFTEGIYWKTFALTFKISIIVTIAALLLGYPVAYAITRLPRRWSMIVLAVVIVPFWTSILVRAYAWLVLLQRSGVVNDSLMAIGLTDKPLSLVHNELGTIIATVHILLPFMVLPLYSTMQKIPKDLLMAGSSLGASPFMVFWRVFFPMSMSGVIAGSTLVFVLCLGFYITPELMGGGRTVMASMLVSRNIQLYSDWGAASAVSVVLLVCVVLIFNIVSRFVPLEKILGSK